MQNKVIVRREAVTIPTYLPAPAEKNPMFLDKRVYQGSSGKVYPLPFTDRVSEEKSDRKWDAVYLENEYLKLMILPEIGGRIHIAQDKTNGYDFFYRQDVIKPALVGLAGPWISGGVEFNWPQHHRPTTFMPADVHIERNSDGSVTVWLSEHEPMNRMKGMHGVCLHPGKALIELKARVYNRTPLQRTFLWWVNAAVRVHEGYQSFFPSDVYYVADHAKRAMSEFPLCRGRYYGVDYGKRAAEGVPEAERPGRFAPPHRRDSGSPDSGGRVPSYPPNDLSWYSNIPVPTSYMCMGTEEDFFGGYDHCAQAGVVHVADRHVSPGKKQWTWGNHEFGYAWDRNLSDSGDPYIELMAGVYTDNQPDFSFLMPGETRTWSQFWYPVREIGPPWAANAEAAVSVEVRSGKARIGVAVTSRIETAAIRVERKGEVIHERGIDLTPGEPIVEYVVVPKGTARTDLTVKVADGSGRDLLVCAPRIKRKGEVPPPAVEPRMPGDIESADELYITGLHLEQYRHATRDPEIYWREAVRRDPGDARCNNALGLACLKRGEFETAEKHFQVAVKRLTLLNPNPADGEPYYNLGLALRWLGRDKEAYAAFYKATWNHAWQAAGYHALAELDCRSERWERALEHLDGCLRVNADNLNARNLRAIVLRKSGRRREADEILREIRALDPLDWMSIYLLGGDLDCDTQCRLDLAFDFERAGLSGDAITILKAAKPEEGSGTGPIVSYALGRLHLSEGDRAAAREYFAAAAGESPSYCFPSRLEEIEILNTAIEENPEDARAPYYLGNLYYDRGRRDEAISLWQKSARRDPSFATVWRNLGIAYFNVMRKPAKARVAYEKAFMADPYDARILYERDQLWKCLGVRPGKRLAELEKHSDLVEGRDDLSVEMCALFNQVGKPDKAYSILSARRFQPWEGGEGQALGQYVRARLLLGRSALEGGDPGAARVEFKAALDAPENLGEARHLLANKSDILYWLGVACERLGDRGAAERHWNEAASFRGDFLEMSVKAFSEMTYFSGLALKKLRKTDEAKALFEDLLAYAKELAGTEAKIDYFATSLPAMLVFNDDIQRRQEVTAKFLMAQANAGLGRRSAAKRRIVEVLELDPNHPGAADLAVHLDSNKGRRK